MKNRKTLTGLLLMIFFTHALISCSEDDDNTRFGSNSGAFITTWKTNNQGISAENEIIIPGSGTNYDIYWEEYNNPSNNGNVIGNDETKVVFPSPGIYQIQISGGDPAFNRIEFEYMFSDSYKLLTIDQWGDIEWTTMRNAFWDCGNLTLRASDSPNLNQVENMDLMFARAKIFNGDISDWDVSNVRSMRATFSTAEQFNANISDWNVSNVTDFSSIFSNAHNFNADISNWNTSNSTSMNQMFFNSYSFNKDIRNWDVSNVTNMSLMFYNSNSFNSDISNWDVSNVTNMNNMFFGADIFSQFLSSWNVENVINCINFSLGSSLVPSQIPNFTNNCSF